MAQVFISHAHEDRAHAEALASWLEDEGWTVWWDTEILAGSAYRAAIEDELDAANCVVVLWSTDSARSHWVADEAQAGAERDILLPVRIDGTSIPLGFRQIQAVRMPHLFAAGTPEMSELRKSLVALIGPPLEVGRPGEALEVSDPVRGLQHPNDPPTDVVPASTSSGTMTNFLVDLSVALVFAFGAGAFFWYSVDFKAGATAFCTTAVFMILALAHHDHRISDASFVLVSLAVVAAAALLYFEVIK